jgi:hypothetical protein
MDSAFPGNERPGALVNVVERGLRQDFGQRDAARNPRIPGDERRDQKGVETASNPPADRLRYGPYVGFARSNQLENARGAEDRWPYGFDGSESDSVTGLWIDQNETTGVSTIRITVHRDEAIDADRGPADVVRGEARGTH